MSAEQRKSLTGRWFVRNRSPAACSFRLSVTSGPVVRTGIARMVARVREEEAVGARDRIDDTNPEPLRQRPPVPDHAVLHSHTPCSLEFSTTPRQP
jgi:hypothetical protein